MMIDIVWPCCAVSWLLQPVLKCLIASWYASVNYKSNLSKHTNVSGSGCDSLESEEDDFRRKTTLQIPPLSNRGELRYDYENPYEKQATRRVVVMMKTHPRMHVKPWESFLPAFVVTSGWVATSRYEEHQGSLSSTSIPKMPVITIGQTSSTCLAALPKSGKRWSLQCENSVQWFRGTFYWSHGGFGWYVRQILTSWVWSDFHAHHGMLRWDGWCLDCSWWNACEWCG